MNINVAPEVRDHFWEEVPEYHHEFWSFRWKPKCVPGEVIYFRFDKKIVAYSIVDFVERPGQSKDGRTGKFLSTWKVYWRPEDFHDLRGEKFDALRKTLERESKTAHDRAVAYYEESERLRDGTPAIN